MTIRKLGWHIGFIASQRPVLPFSTNAQNAIAVQVCTEVFEHGLIQLWRPLYHEVVQP